VSRIAVITIEGVLAETDDLMTTPPTKLGKDLYDGLRATYRVILFSNQSDKELARYWLRKEGFKGWAMIMAYPSTWVGNEMGWKVSSVREMLGDGWDVGVVIDCDHRTQRAMLDEGIASMLVSYPAMARPGKLPESPGPLRPWSEIAATVEDRNLLKQEG